MNFLIAADFAPQARIKELILKQDFRFFDDIRRWTNQADYSIVNLEAPLIQCNPQNAISKTGPNLCAPVETTGAIRYAGFDAVTLANNHFRDYGQAGVDSTINACQEAKIDYVGGGTNIEKCRKPLFKSIKGERIAIINVCENEWSIATAERGGSNPLNPIQQYYDIQEAKKEAQYIIVIVHGGTEWYNLPSPRMKETYRFFIDAGADAVINHHQHCYSGYETYNNKPIFYGLGNFCFDKGMQEPTFWNEGYMVMIKFDKTISFELIPYVQCAREATITILEDRTSFYDSIEKLNEIIANDNLLQIKFQEKAFQRGMMVKELLEPFPNRIFTSMRARGWFPSLVSKKKLTNLLAHTQCEAHRDIMVEYLQNIIK